MKLYKALLIIPVFLITACKSDPVNPGQKSSEVTKYQVSEEVWGELLGPKTKFFGLGVNAHYDVVTTGRFESHVTLDLDYGKYHYQVVGSDEDTYYEFIANTYEVTNDTYTFFTYYKDGNWKKIENEGRLLTVANYVLDEYYPLSDMSSFEYCEDSQSYITESYKGASSHKYVFRNVEVKFEDNKVTYLKYHMEHNSDPSYAWEVELTISDIGTTQVTLPVVPQP